MIIKKCPTCKKTFKARSKNSKNCSRECGDISAKKTRKMMFEKMDTNKDGTISVRKHGGEDLGSMSVAAFAELVQKEISETIKTFEV